MMSCHGLFVCLPRLHCLSLSMPRQMNMSPNLARALGDEHKPAVAYEKAQSINK
jgi:hypothetical protein